MKRAIKQAILPSLLVFSFGLWALAGATGPDDQYFSQQWSLSNNGSQSINIDLDSLNIHILNQKGVAGVDIGWLAAQPQLASAKLSPVKVAVIDSGVDPSHPDLKGRLSADGKNFLCTGLCDPSVLMDDEGHGTHVTGIIAAAANNGIGIAGVAPSSVTVMPLRVLSNSMQNDLTYNYCDSSGKCGPRLVTDFVADAVNYAVAHQASIINMSMSWPKLVDDANVRSAVEAAVSSGVLVVVSAGNDRKNRPTYPCEYEGVLCVGSVSNNGGMSLYTNFGGSVDILAPGDDILSLFPTGISPITGTPSVPSTISLLGYELMSGTSMSSPEVAGVAAALKSLNPSMSVNELKARLMASAVSSRTDQALYGRINLARAMSAKPQPVYVPDFKSLGDLLLNESTLAISGSLSVQNLWQASSNVKAEILINGVAAGTAQAASLAGGAALNVPWSYKFASLSDSSMPTMTVHVSDGSGVSKDFTADLFVARPLSAVAGNRAIPVPNLDNGAAPNFIGTNIGQTYSNLQSVVSYPSESGLPKFFEKLSSNANGQNPGMSVLIYDPSDAKPIHTVFVPGVSVLGQVIRLDANRDGHRDWVITGAGQGASGPGYLQFYFLNPQYQPLWGSNSEWRLAAEATYWNDAKNSSYSATSAWILSGNKLVPSFIASNVLPDPDNYDPLDSRYYNSAKHLYYLSPASAPSADGSIALTIRAVDSATFRTQYGEVSIGQPIPQSLPTQTAGHARVLMALGDGMAAQTQILDLTSVSDYSVQPDAGMDQLTASGTPVVAQPAGVVSWLNSYDSQRASFSWSTTTGNFIDHQDFSFVSSLNPLETLVGAFDFANGSRYWFFESQYDLVGYRLNGSSSIETKTFSIERDTSLETAAFNEKFTPVLVGPSAHPLPGVYVDATQVTGNRVTVAVWNPSTDQLTKPLRYALEIPAGCYQLSPVQMAGSAAAFALPLFCQTATGLQFQVVQPDLSQ